MSQIPTILRRILVIAVSYLCMAAGLQMLKTALINTDWWMLPAGILSVYIFLIWRLSKLPFTKSSLVTRALDRAGMSYLRAAHRISSNAGEGEQRIKVTLTLNGEEMTVLHE